MAAAPPVRLRAAGTRGGRGRLLRRRGRGHRGGLPAVGGLAVHSGCRADAAGDISGRGGVAAGVDLGGLGLDEGGHLLVARALAGLRPGERLAVSGTHPALGLHLAAWCREHGHRVAEDPAPPAAGSVAGAAAPGATVTVVRGTAGDRRWHDAERAGAAAGPPAARASQAWGLAARGALVEAGGPPLGARWSERDYVWADIAPQLYAAAAASQWDPATAVDWTVQGGPVPADIERAVVQLMTYLVENEQAALIIPARLLSQLHPHYREVMQMLASQAADEARHVEVFTRRALLSGGEPGTSSAGGRASLQTLLDEPDFTTASFLLSVLGEGTFLDLLRFIEIHAPDQVTAEICRRARNDETRHVHFGMAHMRYFLSQDPARYDELLAAVRQRAAFMAAITEVSPRVQEALATLAAGGREPRAIAR